MIPTPQMGLKVWNLLSDYFSHGDLSDNWNKLDGHDHTASNGVPIPTGGLATGAVTSSKLGTGAVTTGAIADGAVTTAKLDDDAVTAAKLAANSVTTPTIAAGAVNDNKIAATTITFGKFAPNTIGIADVLANQPAGTNIGQSFYATDTGQWSLADGSDFVPLGYGNLQNVSVSLVTFYQASVGEIVNVTGGSPTGHSVHLPPPTPGGMVGVCCADPSATGAAPTRIHATAGAVIYGVGVNGVDIKLGTMRSYLIFASDGLNWMVVGGTIDSGWINLNLGSTPNGTPAPGYYTPALRQLGDQVYLRGAMSISITAISATSGMVGPIPTAYQSASAITVPFGYNLGATTSVGHGPISAGYYVFGTSLGVAPEPNNFCAPVDLHNGDTVYFDGVSYSLLS